MSNRLRICLHRGTGLISRLIRWQTRGHYNHASLLLPDGRHFEAREGKGVVMHDIFSPAVNDEVEFFTLTTPLNKMEMARLHLFITEELGAPYDWRAVFMFVTRRVPREASDHKWFCSEIVFAALKACGRELLVDTHAWEVSPDLLKRSPLLVKA